MREFNQRRDVLKGADLVVGPHKGHKGGFGSVFLQFAAHGVQADHAVGIHRQPGDFGALVLLEPLHGVQHGVMLDRGAEDAGSARISVPP